jgi:hypothetical protein
MKKTQSYADVTSKWMAKKQVLARNANVRQSIRFKETCYAEGTAK